MSWKFCPHCGGALAGALEGPPAPGRMPAPAGAAGIYDQTQQWRRILREVDALVQPPTTSETIERLLQHRVAPTSDLPLATVIHVVMDRQVTPAGGTLLQGVVSDGRLGPSGDVERLQRLGYVIDGNRVKLVDDIPVGLAFQALQYWGGERQHKRWHLAQPVYVNPSRQGDPYFMDDRFMAFGVIWRDLDRYQEAMTALVETLRQGFDGTSVGNPLLVDVFWRGTEETRA